MQYAVTPGLRIPSQISVLGDQLHEFQPLEPVIYFLVKDSHIVYVGSTTELANRLKGHREKDFDRVFFLKISSLKDLRALEHELIRALNPPLNKLSKGRWPRDISRKDVESIFLEYGFQVFKPRRQHE